MASGLKLWSARGGVLLVGFATCLVMLLALVIEERWVADDALITFRYVDNLVAGDGLVYNLGERLESFSSPLFVVLLAPFRLLGASSFVTAQLLGVLFTVAELVLIFALLWRHGKMPMVALLAGALFASDRIVYVWATGGLETALYSTLLFACFVFAVLQSRGDARSQLVARASVAHLLLAMARPEGIVFYAIYLGAIVVGGRHDRAWKGRVLRSLMIVGGGVAALLVLRYAYYGALLPHTYYAKVAGVPVGVFGRGYLHAFGQREGFVGVHVFAWLIVCATFIASMIVAGRGSEPKPDARAQQRELSTLALFGVLYLAMGLVITGFEGGDYMTDFRLMRPLMGILFVTAAAAIGHVSASGAGLPSTLVSLGAAAALLGSHGARQLAPAPVFVDAPSAEQHKNNNAVSEAEALEFRRAVQMITYPGDKLLTDVSGKKGYGHQLHTVDATGLTSAKITDNFYLRPIWATATHRDRLPGHARWPKLEFMHAEGFALITPRISGEGPEVPELSERSHRRYRRYRFLHATLAVEDGKYLRFFTTLSADQLSERAEARGLELCWRAPKQDKASCAGMPVTPPHEQRARPDLEQPPGIEAIERAVARTAQDAAKQYFGAMSSADCEWLRATTGGAQAVRDAYVTCEQLTEQLEHMAPVRLWEIGDARPAREANERVMQVKFFLEGKDRVKMMRVAEDDGEWRVTRL